ncbi:MAG: MFS transporter [Rhizobiales bacterium]|nr:MFS transporter [Hyphomicrobiales bacterium]MBO6700407.1 MFS transporter [Hyphomicrobiales bacterium]MBO6737943.1 MFS transporter [Hyphomicrobiales bacterium]MBO6913750.1 MFS transporter [Hyphomicrobiales bacterium]MBO6954355.1 MFS transporter [Hyphomicrobiales bacterium]
MGALAPFTALLISTALLVSGYSLQNALIPLRGEAEAFGAFWVGGLGSGFFLGFALGCWFAPALVARAGHIRVFAAFVGLMSGTILLHPLAIEPAFWVLLRMITGFAMAALYIILESWLNERTDNANRGTVMSFYVMVNFAMIAAGQMLLTTYPLDSFALFTIASVLISFAALPLALSKATQPAPLYDVRLNIRKVYETSPVGLISIIGVGLTTGSFWAFGGIFATRSGMDSDGAALFLTVAIMGAALFQWPIGRASDNIDRRFVMVVLNIFAVLVCVTVSLFSPDQPGLILLAGFLFGAVVFPTYALAVAHTFDHAEADQHVTIASGLLLAFAMGSTIGPLAASLAVNQLGGAGLFAYAALVQALMVLFLGFRIARRGAIAEEEKEDFTLYATAPVGAVLVDSELGDQDIDLFEPEPVVFEPEQSDEEGQTG